MVLRSINSKFYLVSILLLLSFAAGYISLVYFLHQQSRSITLARDAVFLENNVSTLNTYFHEARFWEQVILSKNNPEADRSFAELLNRIRTILGTLDKQQLNSATKSRLSQIYKAIQQYEVIFNSLIQLKTKQSIQSTRMETNYRSMVSVILNSQNSSLLKPLFNFTHFLITYSSSKDSPKYQALKLVIKSLEKRISETSRVDGRLLDYLESFNELLDKNYEMELEIVAINREVESINSQLQHYFSDISLETEALIKQKLEAVVNIRQELQLILLLSTVFGVIFLLLILRHISKSIIGPVKSMYHVVQDVKDGNIRARFESHTKKEDEIVQLGMSLNTMLETLEENNFKLLDYQQELEDKINELSTRERERLELTAKIQRIEKMEAIGTLAGGVAHDLNNILSGVVSYPELLLLEMDEDSPYRKPVLTIQESGKKAAAIVQDLLTLARRGVAVTEVTNLNTLLGEYLLTPEYKQMIADNPDVEIHLDLAEDLLNISGSPFHLTKTIANLILNGVESIENKGIITVKTENRNLKMPVSGYKDVEQGEYAVLMVSDTGIGISADQLDRIFEPFFTNKEMGRSGSGLGLAVVWGTVEDHSGYIDVKSEVGEGTSFTLYFPETRKKPTHTAVPLSIEHYMGENQSILIVDDSRNQREIGGEMLTMLGYNVDSVSSGEEAVEYLRDKSVDLLLLDMIMSPGIDGLETYKRILDFKPRQKAIITSGFSETARVKEAQRVGASQYIKKPYTLEEIGIAIKQELSGAS
ncbi:MAG: response regulator [Desulforhopalus sp.]